MINNTLMEVILVSRALGGLRPEPAAQEAVQEGAPRAGGAVFAPPVRSGVRLRCGSMLVDTASGAVICCHETSGYQAWPVTL